MAEMDPKAQWIPTEFPFALRVTVQSSAPLDYGWRNRTPRMFSTLEEAAAEFEKNQGRGVLDVSVQEAINPATWRDNGRWETRLKRKGRGLAKGRK
jgi:hypothetical protein